MDSLTLLTPKIYNNAVGFLFPLHLRQLTCEVLLGCRQRQCRLQFNKSYINHCDQVVILVENVTAREEV
jgi:hypothetical protein